MRSRVCHLPARRSTLATAALACALSLVATTIVFRLWQRDLHVPFAYSEDALSHAMHVKGIIEHGWYYNNPALGAPFGQHYYDFPLGGEHLQLAVLKILGLVLGNTFLTVNVYYLLTFPLTAIGAALFLRWLGNRSDTAVVFGTLFAFLPYHFARGSRHLFLSGYYLIPFGLYLVVATLNGATLVEARPRSAARSVIVRFASRRTCITLLGCLLLGSTSTYYTVFTALLVLMAAAARMLITRSPSPAAPAAAIVLAMLGALVLNNAPTLLYRQSHGVNLEVAQRNPGEAEYYGLKLSQLVLPSEGHRISALAQATARYRTTSPIPSERGQALGVIGTLGFLGLLWTAIRALLARHLPDRLAVVGPLGFVALAALGLGTVGGGSALISTFISAQIRSWNRISLFIALASLAAVAFFVDLQRHHLIPESRRRLVPIMLAGLLVVGLLDEVPPGQLPDFQKIASSYRSDHAFVAAIEAAIAPRAMVFQLPYRPFPEAGPMERAIDYDHFRAYLNSRHLRWSYGGVKGREADWQEQLRGQSEELLVSRLAAAGFSGIWVDRFAYADEARALEAGLQARVGAPTLVSRDQRFSFFSLQAASSDLRARHPAADVGRLADGTLHPVRSRPGTTLRALHEDHDDWWFDASATADIELENPGPSPREVETDLTLQAVGPEARVVEVRYPDGTTQRQDITPGGTRTRRVVTVGPGRSTLRLTLVDPGPLSPEATPLRIFRPAIYDAPPPGFPS